MEPEELSTAIALARRRRQGLDRRPWRSATDGFANLEIAAMPPEQGVDLDVSPSGGDLAREAAASFEPFAIDTAVAFEIGVDEGGNFIDARTGASNRHVVENYSRMKHGDIAAVSFFASHLAAVAMRTERFESFNRHAMAGERVIYVTTPAVFNVPSASNLLLRKTVERLNIMLSKKGLAPLVVAEQTRLSESPLGYASKSVQERRNVSAAGRGVTIVPENFRDQSVVFLDDLFNLGHTLNRAEGRLQKANVADVFYLIAAKIDPRAVGTSRGAIEDLLNDCFIDGRLESIAPMLQHGNFAVVLKLLRVVLDPKQTEQLPAFLQEIPTSSILKLYAAAASDGFRHRHQRLYLPSMCVLETVLEERGALDAEGHILGGPVDHTLPS